MQLRPAFQAYGFYLKKANKNTPDYHIISDVFGNTSAQAAGLKVNDQIIEVNNENVTKLDQAESKQRCIQKTGSNECTVLEKPSTCDIQLHLQKRNANKVNTESMIDFELPTRKPDLSFAADEMILGTVDNDSKELGIKKVSSQVEDRMGKISTPVAIPDRINIKEIIDEHVYPGYLARLDYAVYAVIVHKGSSCHQRHYYLYVKNSDGKWVLINDDKIYNVSLNKVQSEITDAYILCYEKLERTAAKVQTIHQNQLEQSGIIDSAENISAKNMETDDKDEVLEGEDILQPMSISQSGNSKKIPATQEFEDSEDNEHDYAMNRTTSSRILTSEAISNLLGVDVPDKFSKSVSEYKKLKLASGHLQTIKERCIIKQQEKQAKQQSGDKSDSKKRDFTVPEIVIQYVKTINPYCSLQTYTNKFTVATERNSPGHLMRTVGYCGIKNPDCPFRFTFKARYIRKPERQALKEAFEQGASPTLVFHKRLAQIPRNILKAGNLDGAGKSVAIYQKIAAFNESASFNNCATRLSDLKQKYRQQIMPHGPVPGIIQRVGSDPLIVICLTSTALALWDMHATDENAEFTWDATGNVVQCLDLKKKILYYELTMANPIKRGTPIPLTFLLSETQDAVTIKHWLETFKQLYLKQYDSTDKNKKKSCFQLPRLLSTIVLRCSFNQL
ncbi:unnamed protein product [Didymodactylos carnosus]|uniref:Uncharacterized protein n=1 Tax=Didymodactylos carnosus TaxID=1234261 RepID=A0A8S2EJ44_9BILA|nr:unnamed protein product [Didymodactylos carnosus]CAF3998768.1 unnamed protein product [Didymodactylos carnosus]